MDLLQRYFYIEKAMTIYYTEYIEAKRGVSMNLRKFDQNTKYDREKVNKADNYEFLNANYCKKGQIVLAGDSITEFYNMDLFDDYTARTGKLVYNRGISGDTSNRLLERFERNVLNLEPTTIALLIGTNDMNRGADNQYIIANTEKLIRLAKEKCPGVNIILEAVYPVNTLINSQGKRHNHIIKDLNKGLEGLAAMMGVEFVDMTEQLSDKYGILKKKYTYDGLHVNALAYELITKAIMPYFK